MENICSSIELLILNVEDRNKVDQIAGRLLKSVNRPFLIKGESIRISLSMGIALYPDDGESKEELLGKTDQAMYECKKKGRNCYCFFKDE